MACVILAELVMGADQAHPGRDVGGIVVENLRVERDRLVVVLGLHQDAGVLQLGVGQERGSVIGERQRERQGEHALRIGVAVLRLIDAGQGAEIVGILVERGLDLRGKARRDGKSLCVLIVARVGEEQAAPAVERAGLNLDKLLVDAGGGGVLLLLGVEAGEAVERIGAARVHVERGAELGRRPHRAGSASKACVASPMVNQKREVASAVSTVLAL